MKPSFPEHLSMIEDMQGNDTAIDLLRNDLAEKNALLTLARDAAHIRNRSQLKELIRQKFDMLPGFSQVSIACLSDDKRTFKVFLENCDQLSSHPSFEAIAFNEYPVTDGIHDVIISSSGAVVFTMKELLGQDTIPVNFLYEAGIREIAGIRLQHQEEIIGTMVLLAGKEQAFTVAHLRLIDAIAHHISAAVFSIITNEQIESQFLEINSYREKLEEERLYLQEEAGNRFTYNDIIGSAPAMQKVFNLLSQVAFTQSSVLILGETGTGKELVARAIHNSSTRKHKLMVKVNCAALPASLIESELFGHEKGSFTGAIERRIGKFELANHGTLFLDEIGEMPLDLQVKLLRAIQEKEIERVGGKSVIKTDVRIIAATNRNLQKEVAEGRFRSDLYYRLNVFPILLPPLRERKEDIPLLVNHFTGRFAKNTGRKNMRIASSAMKELLAYQWPGNVRELEHLLERSILLNQGNVIKTIHLPNMKGQEVKEPAILYNRTLEEVERDYIIGVLKHCNGKIYGPGGAAEILGLHVSTLNSRIKKLGIQKVQTFTVKKA